MRRNDGREKAMITLSPCRCGDPVCKSFTLSIGGSDGRFTEDEARRIVASVNACADIPIEHLEAMRGTTILKSAMESDVKLRIALERIATHFPKLGTDENQVEVLIYSPVFNPVAIAREALGK
jgi:hypothetical protein